MVTATSLGTAVDFLQRALSQGIGVPVLLGNLAEAEPQLSQGDSAINLLVHRVEPDASVGAHNDPLQPWQVRLHVLVTPFSTDAQPSIGLNDLHLLGAVAGFFHRTPVLEMLEIEEEDDVEHEVVLHVVPEELSVETLNQLWSVQGDVGFRPSIGYEVALVPLYLADPDAQVPFPQPLVGDVRAAVTTSEADPSVLTGSRTGVARADLRYTGPFADDTTPRDTDSPAEAAERAARAHHQEARLRVFELGGAALDAFTAQVTAVADRPTLRLVWELRTGDDATTRLAPANDPVEVAAHVGPRLRESVDPASLPGVTVHDVELPDPTDLPDDEAYQLVLRAIGPREPGPDGTPPPPIDILTDPYAAGRPVLVSVYDPAVD